MTSPRQSGPSLPSSPSAPSSMSAPSASTPSARKESQNVSQIRLRVYHEFETPRSGREIVISALPCGQSPQAALSTIETTLADHINLSLYIPHVYDGIAECFIPLTAISAPTLKAEYLPLDTTAPTALPRIDVKLLSKTGNASAAAAAAAAAAADSAATTADAQSLASRLTCDSSNTALTSTWFGIGILRGKTAANHGTLWRSALQFGAAMTFTIGRRYERRAEGSADVYKTLRQIPCVPYPDVAAFMAARPVDAQVVVVEYGGVDLIDFEHPKRAVYVLGSEDCGVPPALVARAQWHVSVPTADGRPNSLNVAATGAIVMYDRFVKMAHVRAKRRAALTVEANIDAFQNDVEVVQRKESDEMTPSFYQFN